MYRAFATIVLCSAIAVGSTDLAYSRAGGFAAALVASAIIFQPSTAITVQTSQHNQTVTVHDRVTTTTFVTSMYSHTVYSWLTWTTTVERSLAPPWPEIVVPTILVVLGLSGIAIYRFGSGKPGGARRSEESDLGKIDMEVRGGIERLEDEA